MGTALMIVFVASIAATLVLAVYGLRVLVGRWDRPQPFQARPLPRVEPAPVVEPPAPMVRVVMPPPPVPYIHPAPAIHDLAPAPVRGAMATPPPTPQRVARGSIAPVMSPEPRQAIEPAPESPAQPAKQVGPRFTVIKSTRPPPS